MTYEEFKAKRAELDSEVAAASAALQLFPRSAIGLTPDAVKFSPEYRKAKARYSDAARNLRNFNTRHLSQFRVEARAERDARLKG